MLSFDWFTAHAHDGRPQPADAAPATVEPVRVEVINSTLQCPKCAHAYAHGLGASWVEVFGGALKPVRPYSPHSLCLRRRSTQMHNMPRQPATRRSGVGSCGRVQWPDLLYCKAVFRMSAYVTQACPARWSPPQTSGTSLRSSAMWQQRRTRVRSSRVCCSCWGGTWNTLNLRWPI